MLNQAPPDYNYFAVDESPPAFEDIAEGLAHLDAMEASAISEMETEARERMQRDQEDPAKQQFFRREDRRTVVQTEEEYVQCQLKGVPMSVISYPAALQLLKDEDARKRADKKAKKNKKSARQARRRNR